jgi:S-adenosylmethionine uptake transporter
MVRRKPIFLAILAVFLGCVLDALVKFLALELAVTTLTLWRYIIGSIVVTAIYVANGARWPSLAAIRFHTLRGVVVLIAAFSFFWALTQLGLAQATVIGFTASLMVAPLARLILGEKMTWIATGAALIGFAGVVLAAQGGGGTSGGADTDRVAGTIAALVAAGTYALGIVLLRLRTKSEAPLTIVMFSNVIPAILGLVALVLWHAVTARPLASLVPPLTIFPGITLLAMLGIAIWWLYAIAYGQAQVQNLAPLEYTALIWSSLLGYLVFAEVPRWTLYVGAAIIITACLIVAFERRFSFRKSARLPTSDILD